jgi:hypothetical protein
MRAKLLGRNCFALLFAALGIACPIASEEYPSRLPPPSRTLFIVAVGGENLEPEAASIEDALRSGLERSAGEGGYSVREDANPILSASTEGTEASDRARKAGARWAAVYEVGQYGERVVYRTAVYDSADARLIGGDSFAALLGITAIPLVSKSADELVSRIGEYAAARSRETSQVVDYQVVVKCDVDEAAVSVEVPGAPRMAFLGNIKGGELKLPYLPFLVGTTLSVSAIGKGGALMRASAFLGPEPVSVNLVREKLDSDALIGIGTMGLPDIRAALRAYIHPDWDFVFLEERASVDASFLRGDYPVIRDEAELGLGGYLFFPPKSRLRLGCIVACGPLFSLVEDRGSEGRPYLDFAITPIDLFGEYRLESGLSLSLGLESKFSVGLSGGILGREWIDRGVPSVSAGILWRRRG